jgi:hypothetical protein
VGEVGYLVASGGKSLKRSDHVDTIRAHVVGGGRVRTARVGACARGRGGGGGRRRAVDAAL